MTRIAVLLSTRVALASAALSAQFPPTQLKNVKVFRADIPIASVQAEGKRPDAIRFNQLNTEMLPTSDFAFRQLGFAYLVDGDTAAALTAWKRRLELQPDNPEAKQLIGRLTGSPAR